MVYRNGDTPLREKNLRDGVLLCGYFKRLKYIDQMSFIMHFRELV